MIQLVEPSRLSEPAQTPRCWICGAGGLRLVKPGNLPDALHPEALRITDAHYGQTADIFQCESCGFLECPNVPSVLELYEQMNDDSYEETRAARARQARALIDIVSRYKKAASLLRDSRRGALSLQARCRPPLYSADFQSPTACFPTPRSGGHLTSSLSSTSSSTCRTPST